MSTATTSKRFTFGGFITLGLVALAALAGYGALDSKFNTSTSPVAEITTSAVKAKATGNEELSVQLLQSHIDKEREKYANDSLEGLIAAAQVDAMAFNDLIGPYVVPTKTHIYVDLPTGSDNLKNMAIRNKWKHYYATYTSILAENYPSYKLDFVDCYADKCLMAATLPDNIRP